MYTVNPLTVLLHHDHNKLQVFGQLSSTGESTEKCCVLPNFKPWHEEIEI